nr:MAG TPA: hypothetical protein [Caudoviricetes sp.]DAS78471.1 MAG TPA: hypothetical protein [Caudoviricetes sp.]
MAWQKAAVLCAGLPLFCFRLTPKQVVLVCTGIFVGSRKCRS